LALLYLRRSIALEDTILADEVQNVRAFGSENTLGGVQNVVNQRLSAMASKIDATLEHLRIGAIKGQILDADGSAVIYDLFTEFGATAHTEIDFDLDAASPTPGVVKKKCHDIRRKIEDELGAQPYEHIHAICGADFFDDLITHSEVEKAYDRYLDGAFLRQGQAPGSFEWGGTVFEEYRGRVGTVDFTNASKAYFFPVGGAWAVPAVQRPCRLRRDRQHHRPAALPKGGRWTSSSTAGSCCTYSRTPCRLHSAARC
jgi:hypothetical protein